MVGCELLVLSYIVYRSHASWDVLLNKNMIIRFSNVIPCLHISRDKLAHYQQLKTCFLLPLFCSRHIGILA